mgnify:CR=1 FL=1|jgi:hypothetical protein
MGLSLDHGGWPEGNPTRQVSIAPSTAPFENLEAATEARMKRYLDPRTNE